MSEKESPQPRSLEVASPRAAAAGPVHAKTLIESELQDMVRWHLAREANAADIIQRLSYRVDQESELAERARTYGARLKLLVARIAALIPPKPAVLEDTSALGICSEAVIQSLDAETAARLLRQFLLHHAQAPSVVLMTAGERLRSKGFERLWQRATRERERIAKWVEKQERRLAERPAPPARQVDCWRAPARSDAGPRAPAVRKADEDDDESAGRVAARVTGPRIFYNPPQIVKWM